MKWKQIQKDYPNMFGIFMMWLYQDDFKSYYPNCKCLPVVWTYLDKTFNKRELYEFFDGIDILCFVVPEKDKGVHGFGWAIQHNESFEGGFKLFDARKEAENIMFTEAFEIAEKKRKNA